MKKTLWIILNIFTFGGAYLYAKIKSKNIQENNKLQKSNKINFSIDKLVYDLGLIKNITNITNTISTVKITVKDTTKINTDNLKNYGVSGVIKSNTGISLVFGDNAEEIKNQIEKKLSCPKF